MLRPTVAAALLLVGLASFGLWRLASGGGHLPFSDGGSPPSQVRVSQDRTYSLAVPGGVRAMIAHGVPTAPESSGRVISLQCTWQTKNTEPQGLPVAAESTTTKAENTVAHFVAPASGEVEINCDGWGAMFVPDSDDRPADLSGWALLVAVITLTVGAALGLSELRIALDRSRASRAADDDDEVERFIDVTPMAGDDGEVGGHYRGDITS